MSGGHWQYGGRRIQDALENITEDKAVLQRWPATAEALRRLADVLYEIEHDMDWDLSSDHLIEDDLAFDVASMRKLRETVSFVGPKVADGASA